MMEVGCWKQYDFSNRIVSLRLSKPNILKALLTVFYLNYSLLVRHQLNLTFANSNKI